MTFFSDRSRRNKCERCTILKQLKTMSLRSKQERLSPFLMTGILFEKESFVMLFWIREMLYIGHNHSWLMLKTSLFFHV